MIQFTNPMIDFEYPEDDSSTPCLEEGTMMNLRRENTVRGLKRVLETWAWRFLVIGIVLILIENVGIAGAILQSWGHINPDQTNHFVFEIGIAFTVAAFLILSSERVLKTEMEQKFVKYLRDIRATQASNLSDIRREYRYALRNLNNLHSLSHFLSDLHDSANVSNEIRGLASEVLGDYAIGLRAISDGFIVEERNWWIEIMKRFYRILQDPRYNCSNAEIRVTHPGPIGIWSSWDELQDTLTAQRDLVNLKNVTIRRVFVGAEDISPDLTDNSTHSQVINDMAEYKILRYYVKRQNPGMIRDVTWIPDLGLFIEWFVRPGGSVEEIKIRSDATERRELETMWQGLMNDINGGRGFEAQNNAEIARELAAKRSASLSLAA